MAFEPDYWKNGESGGTPITAAELNRIEEAGAAKAAQGPKGDPGADGQDGADGHSPEITWDGTTIIVDGVDGPDLQGPQGPKGDAGADGEDGAQGPKGDPGADGQDGADGFPTESQWNDLVARVDALEAAAEA